MLNQTQDPLSDFSNITQLKLNLTKIMKINSCKLISSQSKEKIQNFRRKYE
jgi:hypothetical protein